MGFNMVYQDHSCAQHLLHRDWEIAKIDNMNLSLNFIECLYVTFSVRFPCENVAQYDFTRCIDLL